MMRYVALSYAPANATCCRTVDSLENRLCSARNPWRRAFARPEHGLKLFIADERPEGDDVRFLEDGSGIVLGSLFTRNSSFSDDSLPSRPKLDQRRSREIVSTSGRALISQYWGAYVAFICDSDRHRTLVIRSPINAPLVFHTRFRDVDVFFCSIEDCIEIGIANFSPNWKYIADRVITSLPIFGVTALNEVSELHLSECLEIKEGTFARSCYWDPCTIARSEPIEDPTEAARKLRATTRSCVHAWASEHDSILLRLSGGVDSSIVLACLSDAPNAPSIGCLHHYSDAPHIDERRFARSMARFLGYELLEHELSASDRLDSILGSRRTVSPTSFALPEYLNYETGVARELGASAILSGTMGDGLFQHSPAMPAGSEFLRRHGISTRFAGVVLDVAHLARASVWKVVKTAVTEATFRAPRSPWLPYSAQHILRNHSLLAPDALIHDYDIDVTQFIHPWLRNVEGVPLGKLWQIYVLPYDECWRDPFAKRDDPLRVPPILSQPIVELCLQIPSYLNIRGGWDRAIARSAFADKLSREVRERTSKGTPDEYVRRLVANNSAFLREFLLDGVLVEQKLVDRQKTEAALPGANARSTCPVGTLLKHMCMEAWARQWVDSSLRAAA